MEQIDHDDSTNSSSEEVDLDTSEQGTGRFYECVFCKRGFTTAQALGGHMNIHRKDRANKNRPSLIEYPNKHSELYINDSNPKVHQQITTYPPCYSAVQEAQVGYRGYIAGSAPAALPASYAHGSDFLDRNPNPFDPFGDWRTGLSLQFGQPHMEDEKEKEGASEEEDELDLELRLGHNP
ncbi:hypothetical protein NMG60_11034747 [Bertholletia excelsa]